MSVTPVALRTFINGKNGGFCFEDMRSWELEPTSGYTNVTYINGSSQLFRDDLSKQILAATKAKANG